MIAAFAQMRQQMRQLMQGGIPGEAHWCGGDTLPSPYAGIKRLPPLSSLADQQWCSSAAMSHKNKSSCSKCGLTWLQLQAWERA